jgi:hypothetical protein
MIRYLQGVLAALVAATFLLKMTPAKQDIKNSGTNTKNAARM